ncbi:alanine racemase [Ammoniphilus sp. 3BR4]
MRKNWLHADIETPAVLVHESILKQNIASMAAFSKANGVDLRPHIKTHKLIPIARMQLEAGAIGITTAKLGEAEVMAEHGITDILIAYPMVGKGKLERLEKLMNRAKAVTVLDGLEQAQALSQFAVDRGIRFRVLLEIDTGLKRCGVQPFQEALGVYRELAKIPGICLNGILTHAGHAYGASGAEQVRKIAQEEGSTMVETAALLRKNGFEVSAVSVGATPTVRISGQVQGVTEIRPGNYVFNDLTQVRLGAATEEQCALRVAARVVSQPTSDRLIIDAGAKTLALDQGAHGTSGVSGFGRVIGHPEITIARLSEEHGILQVHGATSLRVGDIIEIIPNHSCPVVNLTDQVFVVSEGKIVDVWKVDARGKSS